MEKKKKGKGIREEKRGRRKKGETGRGRERVRGGMTRLPILQCWQLCGGRVSTGSGDPVGSRVRRSEPWGVWVQEARYTYIICG